MRISEGKACQDFPVHLFLSFELNWVHAKKKKILSMRITLTCFSGTRLLTFVEETLFPARTALTIIILVS